MRKSFAQKFISYPTLISMKLNIHNMNYYYIKKILLALKGSYRLPYLTPLVFEPIRLGTSNVRSDAVTFPLQHPGVHPRFNQKALGFRKINYGLRLFAVALIYVFIFL